MRPSQVSRFMEWRDAQPRYREALREVLAISEAAEAAPEEEAGAIEERWREARARLLEVERLLLAEWERARG